MLGTFRLNFLSVLKGNVVNIQTGHWVGRQSGLGAGSDSFYEYLLKSYILFGEKEDLEMFSDAYRSIQNHLRRGYVISYEYQFLKQRVLQQDMRDCIVFGVML